MSKLFTLQSKAIRAAQEERWEDAITLNQKLLAIDPKNIGALNRLGFAHLQINDHQEAANYYQQVLQLDSSNSVAKKYMDIIKNKLPVKLPKALRHSDFVDEPGKTKSTTLTRLAAPDVLNNLSVGLDCQLKSTKSRVSVHCDGKYIGSLPDDLTVRLQPLLEAGNQYSVKIQSLKNGSVIVFIREREKAENVMHITSFPTESNSAMNLEATDLAREEEDPVYMGETGDDEGENALDSESIEEALKKVYDQGDEDVEEDLDSDDED